MWDLAAHVHGLVLDTLHRVVPELPPALAGRVVTGIADRSGRGDLATNAALVAGQASKRSIPVLARSLAELLAAMPEFCRVNAAPAGFINLDAAVPVFQRALTAILRDVGRAPSQTAGSLAFESDSSGLGPHLAGLRSASAFGLGSRHAGFQVQYAHARCRSVLLAVPPPLPGFRESDPTGLESVTAAGTPARQLLRRLASWPSVLEAALRNRQPNRIVFFLYELAGDFDMVWHHNTGDAVLRFIVPDQPRETAARLALVAATAAVIRSGLGLLGVEPLEEMR